MPFITFTVTGIDAVMNNINKVIGNDLVNTRRTVLNDVANFMVNEMKTHAHVITGRMKASIQSRPLTDNMILVEAAAPYSFYENRRGGAHSFADMAEQATRSRFASIVSSAYGQMFSSL